MNARAEFALMMLVGLACTLLCGAVLFAVSSAIVAFGLWMLRLARLIA